MNLRSQVQQLSAGDVIGDATIHMTYDPSYMRFEEGDGVNADTDGNLTFKGSGDGSSDPD